MAVTRYEPSRDTMSTPRFTTMSETVIHNRVKARRIARNWSQEELARRSGVSRAGISAIEIGRLVPSVAAALGIAGAFGCHVEDLFGSGSQPRSSPSWAWAGTREPTRYWQAEIAGRRLLYPVEELALGTIGSDGVFRHGTFTEHPQSAAEDTLVLACCDPAVGLLAAQLARSSGIRLVPLQRSSSEALSLLGRGLVHVAGIHLGRAGQAEGNARVVCERLGSGYCMLRVAVWEEGVALAPGLGLSTLQAALAARLRWVGREPGSAARQRLDELLADRKPPRRIARDHRGVAQAIRNGWADAGVCHRLVTEESGLDFLGVEYETYDLCWPTQFDSDARIQSLLAAVRSVNYRQLLADLPGIDGRTAGELATV
jgi:molybdate-binding protein/transcriptional regulator with XRE-family HTH domain